MSYDCKQGFTLCRKKKQEQHNVWDENTSKATKKYSKFGSKIVRNIIV